MHALGAMLKGDLEKTVKAYAKAVGRTQQIVASEVAAAPSEGRPTQVALNRSAAFGPQPAGFGPKYG
jgi:hypothetical protein